LLKAGTCQKKISSQNEHAKKPDNHLCFIKNEGILEGIAKKR